jgi:hypothetical protein
MIEGWRPVNIGMLLTVKKRSRDRATCICLGVFAIAAIVKRVARHVLHPCCYFFPGQTNIPQTDLQKNGY